MDFSAHMISRGAPHRSEVIANECLYTFASWPGRDLAARREVISGTVSHQTA